MNRSNFNQTGGYPLKTERLQEMQTAYSIFNALGALAGNLTIISGCELVGTTVKKGTVFINGELLEFREAAVTGTSRVIIIEQNVTGSFKNGTVKNVHTIRYATFGTNPSASWLWSDFKRPIETKAIPSLIDGIINRMAAAETKLATIQAGAEVNVQADWNVTDASSDAFIKNKIILSSPFLRVSSITIGDPITDQKYNVSFPEIGASSYIVLGAIRVNNSASWNDSNDVFWSYGLPTRTGFELYLREVASQVQSITFVYALIPL